MKFSDKVVYQIYPKSFFDTNGDGVGDISGITAKLDYIKSLGVDYIWSTPFFVSPMNDNGYDVANYVEINPDFGNMADVEELIAEADKRGIGLMFDMVFNHTSTSHEWFQRALKGEEKYLNYYIFKDGKPNKPPTNWVSKFGGNAWEYVPHLKKWYLHLFDVSQADLNWENPEVREELKNVLRFWKKKGVKGFRFDVVNLISKPAEFIDDDKGDGRKFYTDGRHVHEFLKELVKDSEIGEMITVGEMSSTSLENCIKYFNPDEKELSMVFNFHHLKVDYKNGDKWSLMPADISALKKLFETWQVGMEKANGWNAVFWCNHDQPCAVSRFGDDEKFHDESAKMLAATIHLMRGTPYIYQGEELGMTNAKFNSIEQYKDVESLNYYKILLEQGKTEEEALKILGERSRDNSRTPMQWDSEKFSGFSKVSAWISSPENYKKINVEVEEKDENSVLNFYKKLVKLRKENKIVQDGEIKFFERENNNVIAYRRILGEKNLIVICNFKGEEISLTKKNLSDYIEEGYKKILGNYENITENLRLMKL